MRTLMRLAAIAVVTVGAGAAQAHTLGEAGAGLGAGLAHPLGGLDHLLAMVAVGLWAVQLGGRALWQVPLAFLGAMAIGGMAGSHGVPMPVGELGIAGSLLVLGALVATAARMPVLLGGILVGFFAVFHGHAHGAEMPPTAFASLYGLGFLLATALLHGIGLSLGLWLAGRPAQWVLRLGGTGVAAAGIAMLVF